MPVTPQEPWGNLYIWNVRGPLLCCRVEVHSGSSAFSAEHCPRVTTLSPLNRRKVSGIRSTRLVCFWSVDKMCIVRTYLWGIHRIWYVCLSSPSPPFFLSSLLHDLCSLPSVSLTPSSPPFFLFLVLSLLLVLLSLPLLFNLSRPFRATFPSFLFFLSHPVLDLTSLPLPSSTSHFPICSLLLLGCQVCVRRPSTYLQEHTKKF